MKYEIEMTIDCKGLPAKLCHASVVKALEEAGYPFCGATGLDPCGHVSIAHGDPHRIWIYYYDVAGVHESTSSNKDTDTFRKVDWVKKAINKPASAQEIKTLIEKKQVSASKKWKLDEVNKRKTEETEVRKKVKSGESKPIDEKKFNHIGLGKWQKKALHVAKNTIKF